MMTDKPLTWFFQGATIVDQSVSIALEPDYKLPPTVSVPSSVLLCSLSFIRYDIRILRN